MSRTYILEHIQALRFRILYISPHLHFGIVGMSRFLTPYKWTAPAPSSKYQAVSGASEGIIRRSECILRYSGVSRLLTIVRRR